MFADEQIFVWDIDALHAVNASPTVQGMLEASVRLRRLLTDSGEPLLHKVARPKGFKPAFRVPAGDSYTAIAEILGEAPQHYFASPFPELGKQTISVGLDAFLALPVHYTDGVALTVKQLINYVANVGGGVHQGKPTNKDNAPIIHETAGTFTIGGVPYPLYSLRPVIQVTLEGLQPLRQQLHL